MQFSFAVPSRPQQVWEADYSIEVMVQEGEVLVRANQAGLISLAKQLLALAYAPDAPEGFHYHYDPGVSLTDDSVPLVIEALHRGR